jgi:very-short-patch-repair endonuclease
MNKNHLIPYNPTLKALARELRKNSTLTEVLIWKKLKGRQMLEYEFHRQVPINEYIVDFYCHELRLAIEIDGDSHQWKTEEDQIRQQRLESLGVRMLRFEDRDVKNDMTNILWSVQCWIADNYPKTSP